MISFLLHEAKAQDDENDCILRVAGKQNVRTSF